jgi:cytochrome c oxidase cbb3-type subunit 3
MNRRATFLGLLIAFVCLAQEAQQAPKKNVVGQPEAQGGPLVAHGKALFQQKCGFCHGPNATGGEGPDLLRSALVSHDQDGNLIGPVLREGRPDKGMPQFQFSDAQVREIAVFIHDQARSAAALYLSGKSLEYPLEKLLVGNAQEGKAYFEGAGKCIQCHATTGDLAHIASRYKPIDLQNRIAYPKGGEPEVTVTLPSGAQIKGKQVYADGFQVSLRDDKGWTHTYGRDIVKIEIRDPLATHQQLLSDYTDKNIHDVFAYLVTLK